MSTLKDIEVKYQHNPDVEYINYEYALGSDNKTPIEPWENAPKTPSAKAPYVLCRVTVTHKNGEKEVVWLDAIGKVVGKIDEFVSPYSAIATRARCVARAKYPRLSADSLPSYAAAYIDGYSDAVVLACDWLKAQFPNTYEETQIVEEFKRAMKGI